MLLKLTEMERNCIIFTPLGFYEKSLTDTSKGYASEIYGEKSWQYPMSKIT